jgi:predicted RNA-binding protein
MCEVKIFKRQDGEEVLLLKDVYLIEQEEEGLRFETIFGEQKVFEAEIESVSLTDNKVIIREKSASSNPVE